MYTVYKHTMPNGKVYVGITKQKTERRWKNGNGYKRNKHFYSAILKYGWDNIKHEIVCTGLSKWQAGKVEQSLIKYFGSTNPDNGYNNSVGGECGALGHKVSTDARQEISEAIKGTHHCAKTRQKISEATKRSYLNHPERRRKISEAHKGTHLSQETRRKISEATKGKHLTKAVVCVETGILYRSVTEAAKATSAAQGAISNAARGFAKTSGGYHWKYAEDMEESK